MDWVARAKRALRENRLFLEAQLIQPLSKRADGSEQLPHYELLVRMRDETGRVGSPRRFPAGGGALQPVDRATTNGSLAPH